MGTPFLNAQSRHSSIIVVKVYFRLYTVFICSIPQKSKMILSCFLVSSLNLE